jgi:ribulose bisphosphate carboxylase small subunit
MILKQKWTEGEPIRTPALLSLILTHKLPWDLWKRPSRRDARTDCFTSTSLVTGFTSLPQKMWVRIRLLSRGDLRAQEFASQMSALLGRSYVICLNQQDDHDRLRNLVWHTERAVRNDVIPFAYNGAMDGLCRAVTSGRMNAETCLKIRAMKTRELCLLCHELLMKCENTGGYATYLMKKYTTVRPSHSVSLC